MAKALCKAESNFFDGAYVKTDHPIWIELAKAAIAAMQPTEPAKGLGSPMRYSDGSYSREYEEQPDECVPEGQGEVSPAEVIGVVEAAIRSGYLNIFQYESIARHLLERFEMRKRSHRHKEED